MGSGVGQKPHSDTHTSLHSGLAVRCAFLRPKGRAGEKKKDFCGFGDAIPKKMSIFVPQLDMIHFGYDKKDDDQRFPYRFQ